MNDLQQILDKYLNEQLVHIVISNPRSREIPSKINFRPVLMKGNLVFQASEYREKRYSIKIIPPKRRQLK